MSIKESHIIYAAMTAAEKSKRNFALRTAAFGGTTAVACVVGGLLVGGPAAFTVGVVVAGGISLSTTAFACNRIISLKEIVKNLSPNEKQRLVNQLKTAVDKAGVKTLNDLLAAVSSPSKLTATITNIIQKFATEELNYRLLR